MGIRELEEYIMNRKDRPNKPLLWPCCKEKLPAPLDGVAIATCSKCDCRFTAEIIYEFNVLLEIANDSEAQTHHIKELEADLEAKITCIATDKARDDISELQSKLKATTEELETLKASVDQMGL